MTDKKFLIESDHNPLTFLKNNSGNNFHLLRWALTLQPYQQGCSGGYTGVYAVYPLDIFKKHRIPSVFQESYITHTLGYTLYLERIPSAKSVCPLFFYDYTTAYQYAIKHRPGKEIAHVDFLSRTE